jgi:VWFA-related protein
VQSAVKRFVAGLKPIDRVTLVAFNERTFVLSRRESESAARVAAVDRLTASGGTALFDAIVTSLNLVGGPISRRALVVFTDGEDTRSLASLEPVERRILESDATVYMITQGTGERADAVRRQTRKFAEISGGRAFPVNKIEELERAFDFIHVDLENQYLIGYEPTNTKRDDTYRKITAAVVKGDYRVRAREGYRALSR